MNRQDGYYWVKLTDDSPWIAAEFHEANRGYWRLPNLELAFKDSHFSQINENRIPAPDETKNQMEMNVIKYLQTAVL